MAHPHRAQPVARYHCQTRNRFVMGEENSPKGARFDSPVSSTAIAVRSTGLGSTRACQPQRGEIHMGSPSPRRCGGKVVDGAPEDARSSLKAERQRLNSNTSHEVWRAPVSHRRAACVTLRTPTLELRHELRHSLARCGRNGQSKEASRGSFYFRSLEIEMTQCTIPMRKSVGVRC